MSIISTSILGHTTQFTSVLAFENLTLVLLSLLQGHETPYFTITFTAISFGFVFLEDNTSAGFREPYDSKNVL